MSTEPKTPEELAEAAFPVLPFGDGVDVNTEFREWCADALRKQAEQCRPYMQHLDGCHFAWPDNICTCGLESKLNAMK